MEQRQRRRCRTNISCDNDTMAGGRPIDVSCRPRRATGPEEAGGPEQPALDANGDVEDDQDDSETAPEGLAPPLEQDGSEGDEPGDHDGPTVQGELICFASFLESSLKRSGARSTQWPVSSQTYSSCTTGLFLTARALTAASKRNLPNGYAIAAL